MPARPGLPQDVTAPSARHTVMAMVRNRNNLENLKLTRKLEAYNKQLIFRVKTHDFEKLDTFDFLRNLKECDSDKLAQYKDLQQSIRDMPTPASHVTVSSLDLTPHRTAVRRNPYVKHSFHFTSRLVQSRRRDDFLRLPVISRAHTFPVMDRMSTSVTVATDKDPPRRKKAAKLAWESAPDISATDDRHVSGANSKPTSPGGTGGGGDVENSGTSGGGDVENSGTSGGGDVENSGTSGGGDVENSGTSGGGDVENSAELHSASEERCRPISEGQMTTGRYFSDGNLKGDNNDVIHFPSNSDEDTFRSNSKQLKSSEKSADNLITIVLDTSPSRINKTTTVDTQDSFVNEETEVAVSSTNQKSLIVPKPLTPNRKLSLYPRESRPPEKISLTTLLSMGLGSLKNPKDFQYGGATYAERYAAHNNKKLHSKSKPRTFSRPSKKPSRSHLSQGAPVEVRMQTFFGEVEKLVPQDDAETELWKLLN